VRSGPYRFIPHPNYLAVALELFALPLVFEAWITALAASVLNAILLLGVRIPTEERALRELGN
jgi:methyltransferase